MRNCSILIFTLAIGLLLTCFSKIYADTMEVSAIPLGKTISINGVKLLFLTKPSAAPASSAASKTNHY